MALGFVSVREVGCFSRWSFLMLFPYCSCNSEPLRSRLALDCSDYAGFRSSLCFHRYHGNLQISNSLSLTK